MGGDEEVGGEVELGGEVVVGKVEEVGDEAFFEVGEGVGEFLEWVGAAE